MVKWLLIRGKEEKDWKKNEINQNIMKKNKEKKKEKKKKWKKKWVNAVIMWENVKIKWNIG